MTTIGQRLRSLRGQENQESFANRIGVNINTLRAYEKDRNSPNADTIISICRALNTSSEWLLFGEGPMERGEAAEAEALPAGLPPLPVYQGPCQRCEWLEQDLKIEREERRELQQELREMREERRTLADENRGLLKANADLRVELERLRPRAGPDETCNGDKDDLQQSA